MTGLAKPEETTRWEEIKGMFLKKQKMMGLDGGDRIGQVVATLTDLVEAVKGGGKMAKG